jgi:hypothetical protein
MKMAFEQKPNTGALFKNEDRTEENQRPHYQGSLNVRGEEFWLSAYINTSKNGMKCMSLALKPKVEPKADTSQQPKKSRSEDFNDSIPF